MKTYIFNIILILTLISSFQSQLTEEERQNLLDKVFNKKNKPELEKWIFPAKANDEEGQSLNYDPEKIKQIINKYKFPESYNFIEAVNPPVNIKNQESCGCCWAFAATTALAYRYYKKGVTVDLSPQYMLSCFSGDCDSGGYLIDTQFLLVNNELLLKNVCLSVPRTELKLKHVQLYVKTVKHLWNIEQRILIRVIMILLLIIMMW